MSDLIAEGREVAQQGDDACRDDPPGNWVEVMRELADALDAALAVVEAVRARYDCGCPGHPQKHYYWCADVTKALAAYDARRVKP